MLKITSGVYRGRLIQSLIYNVDDLTDKLISIDESIEPLVRDYQIAFDADIINLLIGPLAEAKQAYLNDDEQFNYQNIYLIWIIQIYRFIYI